MHCLTSMCLHIFPVVFLFLIPLWSENTVYIILILSNKVCLDKCFKGTGKKCVLCCCWREYSLLFRFCWLIVLFTSLCLLILCLVDLSVTEMEVMRALTIFFDVSIFSLGSVSLASYTLRLYWFVCTN